MEETTYAGIDYGLGKSNIDQENGIRFGVIHHRELGEAWYEGAQPNYGKPQCPECNGEAVEFDEEKHAKFKDNDPKFGGADYACESCEKVLIDMEVFPESPISWTYEEDGYKAEQGGEDTDVFVVKSPYYTHAQFCSPCAPGAGYLMNPCKDGPKTYCFGHDWFPENKAPYPVYSVETGEEVKP